MMMMTRVVVVVVVMVMVMVMVMLEAGKKNYIYKLPIDRLSGCYLYS